MDASGRINWWRLYRFPPVASAAAAAARAGVGVPVGGGESSTTAAAGSPRTGGAAATVPFTSPSPSPALSTPTSRSFASVTAPSPSTAPTTPDSTPNGRPSTTGGGGVVEDNTSTVIPVIIVGLQSVNAPDWRPVMPMDGMEETDLFDERPTNHTHTRTRHNHNHPTPRNSTTAAAAADLGVAEEPTFGNDDDDASFFNGFGPYTSTSTTRQNQNQNQNQERRRGGWQNRAASALRNLRPGTTGTSNGTGVSTNGNNRRSSSQGLGTDGGGQQQVPNLGGPGSRTFLIYVIGGELTFFSGRKILLLILIDFSFGVGYYPPDHSIVTGGPDNLESFEALL